MKADRAGLADKLGERYEVTRTDIKKWSVGSPIQAALDGRGQLAEAAPIRARSSAEGGHADRSLPGLRE